MRTGCTIDAALVTVFVAAFADGMCTHSPNTALRVLAIFTLASAITLCCTLDANVNGKLFLRSFAWHMMFTWPVGVLVHLVWTRRWQRGLLAYMALLAAYIAATGAGRGFAGLLRGK